MSLCCSQKTNDSYVPTSPIPRLPPAVLNQCLCQPSDSHQIEFPSILLPPDIHSGSIVDINVSRNQHAELIAEQKFNALQDAIFTTFGTTSPSPPVLRCRNATQTSVVLEWDPIDLASAEWRSLSLYRNGAKVGVIPRDKLVTKISGLALDTEYTFHLVLRTSAGVYASDKVVVKTHKMTDLHGITITPGVMPQPLRDSLAETVNKIGAKMIDQVRIDTTHFVCTEPRGQGWDKAVEMNVPVVVPDWLKGCEREGRIVGVRAYYLDADPSKRQIGPSSMQQQRAGSVSSVATQQLREGPRIEHTPPTPERPTREERGENGGMGAEPPAPPPKPVHERLAEQKAENDEDGEGEETEGQSLGGTTLAERPKFGDQVEEDEEEDDDDEDDRTQQGEDPEKSVASTDREAAENETTKDEALRAAEEDGKFDEVAL